MPKPIVVVTIPPFIPRDTRDQLMNQLENKLHDYHVLLIHGDVKFPTINVFHEKDFTEIEYGELTQLILESQTNV